MVGIPSGRVSSATTFIMIAGPMATTRSGLPRSAMRSVRTWVTKPLRP